MTDIAVQKRILEDLYKVVKSGMINIKGGMEDILELLENAKKTDITTIDLWRKISNICHSRNRNDYTAAGLRNFFSRSNFFGTGRDPMAALIYQAIDDIFNNETDSGDKIENLTGLLNTHQKRRAYIRLRKEIIMPEDAGLLEAINKSLQDPNQPLYNIMRIENNINIYICASPPKKLLEFPEKKSVIISRVKNDYYAYTRQLVKEQEIVVGKKLDPNEIPEQMKRKHFELELQKIKEERMNKIRTKNEFSVLYLEPSAENDNKYKHIVKKLYPDIHHDKPAKFSASETLSQNFVFQQVASYAKRLYKILYQSNLFTEPDPHQRLHSFFSNNF